MSDRSGFVFVHNPKCGGSVFRDAIATHHDHAEQFWHVRADRTFGVELDFAHLRLWEVRAMFPDIFRRLGRLRSIAFVRNPRRRFVSALHQHFRTYRPWSRIDECGERDKLALFRPFIETELTRERILADYRFVHFSPQVWFCALGGRREIGAIIPLAAGSNPIDAARNALEIDIPTAAWREERFVDDTALLDDPVLADASDRLFSLDYDFLGSVPHLRAIV